MIQRFECQKCGNCCRNTRVNICYSDIERWKNERRWDILSQVGWVTYNKTDYLQLALLKTLPKNAVCPYLSESNLCKIHETKPRVCKDFPICGTAEKLSLCKGIGQGPKLNPKIVSSVHKRQVEDLAKVMAFRNEISAILLGSRFLQFQLENGYAVFDESIGKYKPTPKGLRFLEREKKRIERKARSQNKTVQQLSEEAFEQMVQFLPLDQKLVKRWQRSRRKRKK